METYNLPLRVVFALIIINKAGGLIYQRDFAEGLNKLSINDYLVLAGTFHGVHAITTRLHPLQSHTHHSSLSDSRPDPPSGIEVLETENFRLQCFSTLTGTKFLLFTEPQQPNVDKIVSRIYELYSDYVMKNPFYQLEMPVRCESFDRKLVQKGEEMLARPRYRQARTQPQIWAEPWWMKDMMVEDYWSATMDNRQMAKEPSG
ncbi:hypothetical protein EG329_012682 [Mollisiaceae sp. DMI_Dod_QoI]|nr:hypothetical protein EG329_012682 [Helotiales sp. DMI_Dod_QoI]